ncbi:MAG: uroporphyrinogen-III synthase [Chloroflexi bacterium]|nr:uroporphyrinogen-III synthase [Chloroflexota bacterium]
MTGAHRQVIAITEERRAAELARLVENLGRVPLIAPTVSVEDAVDLESVDRLCRRLRDGTVDWVVFQTGIGVQRLLAAVADDERPEVIAALGRCRLAARGPKPRQALAAVGLTVDLAPAEPTTRGLVEAFAALDLAGRTIAIQHTGDDNEELRQALLARGADVLDVALYRYGPPRDPAKVHDLIDQLAAGRVAAITFTSSPAVRGLFAFALREARSADLQRGLAATVVAAVGPTTAATLRDHGVVPSVIPARSAMGAMVVELSRVLDRAVTLA